MNENENVEETVTDPYSTDQFKPLREAAKSNPAIARFLASARWSNRVAQSLDEFPPNDEINGPHPRPMTDMGSEWHYAQVEPDDQWHDDMDAADELAKKLKAENGG